MWVLTLAGHKALSPFTLFSLNFDTGFFLPYRLQSGRFHTVKNKDGPSPLSNIRPYQAQVLSGLGNLCRIPVLLCFFFLKPLLYDPFGPQLSDCSQM